MFEYPDEQILCQSSLTKSDLLMSKHSKDINDILAKANEIAQCYHYYCVQTGHLLLAIVQNAPIYLKSFFCMLWNHR